MYLLHFKRHLPYPQHPMLRDEEFDSTGRQPQPSMYDVLRISSKAVPRVVPNRMGKGLFIDENTLPKACHLCRHWKSPVTIWSQNRMLAIDWSMIASQLAVCLWVSSDTAVLVISAQGPRVRAKNVIQDVNEEEGAGHCYVQYAVGKSMSNITAIWTDANSSYCLK